MNDPQGTIRIAFVGWRLDGIGGPEKVVYDIVWELDKNVITSGS
jgi:hypothetical protein